jgi:hypothetical protein
MNVLRASTWRLVRHELWLYVLAFRDIFVTD